MFSSLCFFPEIRKFPHENTTIRSLNFNYRGEKTKRFLRSFQQGCHCAVKRQTGRNKNTFCDHQPEKRHFHAKRNMPERLNDWHFAPLILTFLNFKTELERQIYAVLLKIWPRSLFTLPITLWWHNGITLHYEHCWNILMHSLLSSRSKWSVKDTDGQLGEQRKRSNQFHTYCCLPKVHNNSAEPALWHCECVRFIGIAPFGSAWCSTRRLQWSLTSTWEKKKMSCKHFCEKAKIPQLFASSSVAVNRWDWGGWPICGECSSLLKDLL